MRIVYLSGTAQLGGAERCLLDVMESVRAEQPAWSLCLIASDRGPLVDRAQSAGFPVEVVPFPRALASLGDSGVGGSVWRLFAVGFRTVSALGAIIRYRRQLRRALIGVRPDVVHTNGYKTHILGAWTRPSAAALVWHLHDYVSSRPVMAWVLKRHASACRAGIAVSASVGWDAEVTCQGRFPVYVVPNGVNLEEFQPEGPHADLDALSGLPAAPAGTVRVGLVATLGRFKGHDVFLRAIAQLPRTLPLRGYIVGGSVYRTRGSESSLDALRSLAAELGIADRIGFTGFQAEPANAMRALDVVVHASITPEPFGLVIAEGMACGRAVIVSAAGGAGEIVEPNVDALTHAPGDIDGLATAIRTLVTDPLLRARLGAKGRRSAMERFDRRRLGAMLLPIYAQVVLPVTAGAVGA